MWVARGVWAAWAQWDPHFTTNEGLINHLPVLKLLHMFMAHMCLYECWYGWPASVRNGIFLLILYISMQYLGKLACCASFKFEHVIINWNISDADRVDCNAVSNNMQGVTCVLLKWYGMYNHNETNREDKNDGQYGRVEKIATLHNVQNGASPASMTWVCCMMHCHYA
jgi:hypothetical protein